MVKLHCDRCGKEIKEGYYYTINICKEDINPTYDITDYASALSNFASNLKEGMLAQLNAQKMYCEKCKGDIQMFISGNEVPVDLKT